MKKILLTTTMLVGFAVAANATEAGKMYVRGDLGYQFSGSENKALDTKKSGKRLKGFVGDIGFGYAIADNVRTDLTVNFSNPSVKTKATAENTVTFNDKTLKDAYDAAVTALADLTVAGVTITQSSIAPTGVVTNASYTVVSGAVASDAQKTAIKAENDALDAFKKGTATFGANTDVVVKEHNRSMGLMANVYYDFSTGSAFTPYVMGGIGVTRSKNTATFSGKYSTDNAAVAQSYTLKSANKTGFAYAIGAGVGYEMAKDVVLDVGYKLTGRPSNTYTYKFADGQSLTKGSNAPYNKANPFKIKSTSVAHAFTAGVRFAF